MSQLLESARKVSGWGDLFTSELMAAELASIESFYRAHPEQTVVPAISDVFRAFELTPLVKVKVVLVGQDPYPQLINRQGHEVPRSMGLSFSVRRGDVIPVSLQNIYKELKSDISDFVIPDHGDLSSWAEQGVLLLNTSLTTFAGAPNAHAGIWNGVIELILQALNKSKQPIWFLLWGNNAKEILRHNLIDEKQTLTAAHPSGLSARKGFFGCRHFSQVNKLLSEKRLAPIDWKLHQPIPKPLFADRPIVHLKIKPITQGLLNQSVPPSNVESADLSTSTGTIEVIPNTNHALKISQSSSDDDDIIIRSLTQTPEPLPTIPKIFN